MPTTFLFPPLDSLIGIRPVPVSIDSSFCNPIPGWPYRRFFPRHFVRSWILDAAFFVFGFEIVRRVNVPYRTIGVELPEVRDHLRVEATSCFAYIDEIGRRTVAVFGVTKEANDGQTEELRPRPAFAAQYEGRGKRKR